MSWGLGPDLFQLGGLKAFRNKREHLGEADEGVFRVSLASSKGCICWAALYSMHGVLPQEVFKTSRADVFGYSGMDL